MTHPKVKDDIEIDRVVVPVRVAPDGLTVVSTSGVFPVVETRKF